MIYGVTKCRSTLPSSFLEGSVLEVTGTRWGFLSFTINSLAPPLPLLYIPPHPSTIFSSWCVQSLQEKMVAERSSSILLP